MMAFDEFLTRVIDEGILAARADYVTPSDNERLRGSIDGFELCREKDVYTLGLVLEAAEQDAHRRLLEQDKEYWYWRCRVCEVEWVCNVISAALINIGDQPIRLDFPTVRGCIQAAKILGVANK